MACIKVCAPHASPPNKKTPEGEKGVIEKSPPAPPQEKEDETRRFGGKDSVKENRQGCLSRLIRAETGGLYKGMRSPCVSTK